MKGSTTLQFFADVLDVNAEDHADGLVTVDYISAIVPTNGQRRQERSQFSGTWAEYKAMRAPQTHQAYAIPVGTVLVPSVGVNGATVRGNASFWSVPDAVLVEDNDLGTGTSGEIRDALAAWIARQS